MSQAFVSVSVDSEGRAYPFGSDTPLPAQSIRDLWHDASVLREGDLIIDRYGKPYQIVVQQDEDDDYSYLVARDLDKPNTYFSFSAVHTPAVRVYHRGEPRDDYIA